MTNIGDHNQDQHAERRHREQRSYDKKTGIEFRHKRAPAAVRRCIWRRVPIGIAIWVGAWPMFGAPIALFATANWVHIPFEEVKMRRQFGAAYDNYVARVRRWI